MKKNTKNQDLDLIKLSRQIARKEAIANGTWMPRGAVYDKDTRKKKREDAKYKDAFIEH